jgi:hypothetical protein
VKALPSTLDGTRAAINVDLDSEHSRDEEPEQRRDTANTPSDDSFRMINLNLTHAPVQILVVSKQVEQASRCGQASL